MTNAEKTVDVLMCVFDDGKLIDVRKTAESLVIAPGESKTSTFRDLSWKIDQDKLTIKNYVWERGAKPSAEVYENSAQVKTPYEATVIEATDTNREITFVDLYGETIYKLYLPALNMQNNFHQILMQ